MSRCQYHCSLFTYGERERSPAHELVNQFVTETMKDVNVSTVAKAPISCVWDIMTNLEECSKHVSSIISIERVSGDEPGKVALGTTWKETRKMFGQDTTETMGVTSVDTPDSDQVRSYTVESVSCGTNCKSVMKVEALSPEGGEPQSRLSIWFGGEEQTPESQSAFSRFWSSAHCLVSLAGLWQVQ
jgi:hypothetical protein